MSFSNTDLLKHILQEAELIIQNLEGLSVERLEKDMMLQHALVRCFEIMGEASKNIDESFRLKYPQLEWRNMAKMRDRLVHHYFDIDNEVLYETCMSDMSELAFDIKAILLIEEDKENNETTN